MKKGLDAYKLKLIALIFMIVDHVYKAFDGPLHASQPGECWPQWLPVTARFVMPLFLFLMIEGFYHTRSRIKYLLRLFGAELVMTIGSIPVNYYTHVVDPVTGEMTFKSLVHMTGIFYGLGCLLGFVWCLDNFKQGKNRVLNIFLAIVWAVLSFFGTGLYLLPLAFFMWLFRGRKVLISVGTIAWSAVLLMQTLTSYNEMLAAGSGPIGGLYTHLCYDNEWAMFLVIPFIFLYNGERGKNTAFTKYFFYVFFPVHLWILAIARFAIFKQ